MASFLSLTARPRQWALQTFLFIFFFVSYCCPSPVSQSAKLSKTGRSWCFYLPTVHDNKNTRLVRDTQPTFAIRLMRERRSAERTVVFHQPFIIREGNWTSLRWQPPSLTPPLNLRAAQQKPPHPFVFQKLLPSGVGSHGRVCHTQNPWRYHFCSLPPLNLSHSFSPLKSICISPNRI